MNRLIVFGASLAIGIILCCSFAVSSAKAAAMAVASAGGEGSMSFGHEGEGRAWLKFTVQDGDQISGSLLFAAEDHHSEQMSMMFPDVIVRLSNIQEVTFKDKLVKFSGSGTLHDDPINVSVIAYDNSGSKKPDRFVIKCRDNNGKITFKADGELFRGNIQVGGD